MKKILSFLLVVAMLCVAFPITASAAATPTIAVGSTQGAAGSTVLVAVSVQNNPGIVSAYLKLSYDTTRLQLTAIEDGGLLPDPMFGETASVSPQALHWDGGDLEENITANGQLVILTFKILDNAPLGKAAINLALDGGIINSDLDPVAFTLSAGSVTVVSSSAVSTITTASIALSSDISVKYYATLAAEHVGAQMRFTMNDTVTYVNGVKSGSQYTYTFKGVAPQCMGDNICAELVLNGEVLASKPTNSVKSYCSKLMSYSAAQLGMSASKYAAMKTAIADLLEYGSQAQLYKGYKTDALVNAGVTGQTTFQTLTTTDKTSTTSTSGDVALTSVGVFFDYVNSLYIDFKAVGMTESNFYVMATNSRTGAQTKYTLSDCTVTSAANSRYRLNLDPVHATGFNDCYTIELFVKGSGTTYTAVQTLTYSIRSYVYSMQSKTDGTGALTQMAQLSRATYNYGLSASAYASAQ